MKNLVRLSAFVFAVLATVSVSALAGAFLQQPSARPLEWQSHAHPGRSSLAAAETKVPEVPFFKIPLEASLQK
jgi:hypothetical protein